MTAVQEATLSFTAFTVYIFGVVGWFYGLYYSVKTQQAFMFTLDFVVPPVGAIHGWGALLGFW